MNKAVLAAACIVLALPAGAASAHDRILRSPVYIGGVTGDAEQDTFGYAPGAFTPVVVPVLLSDDARYVGTRTGDEERDTFARTARQGSTATTASTILP